MYILSPTSLLCWGGWPRSYLPCQGFRQDYTQTLLRRQNQHCITVRNPETGPGGQAEPGSLYAGDNVLLESGLLAGERLTVLISHQALLWFIYAFAGPTRRDIHYGTPRKPLYLPESPSQTAQGSWEQGTVRMMLPSDDSVTEYQESHSHYTVPVCG